MEITDLQRQEFREQGVVCLSGVLDDDALRVARQAFDWSIANPGPGATNLIPGSPGSFYGDLANPAAFPPYADVNSLTPLPEMVSQLWDKQDVWFMYEQVFLKTGGKSEAARRTPWHQDLSYLPVMGEDLAVIWIPFESLTASQSLEFIPGSHRKILYDGSRFDPKDDTAPLYGTGEMPRLPDIEAERGQYQIVSYPVNPGDVVVFHPALLHGGAATPCGDSRHTLSLRYFGDDAVVQWRPGDTKERVAKIGAGPNIHPMTKAKKLGPGAAFRESGFPKVR